MVKNTSWFLTSIVLFGTYALFAQVLLLREFLVIFYGNEICLGLIFCGRLFWIALMSWSRPERRRVSSPRRRLMW